MFLDSTTPEVLRTLVHSRPPLEALDGGRTTPPPSTSQSATTRALSAPSSASIQGEELTLEKGGIELDLSFLVF